MQYSQGVNQIGPARKLEGVLSQCTSLVYLDLCNNGIGDAGAESLAGVLAKCPALAHLDLSYNEIGTVGEGRLRASWGRQASSKPCVLEEDDDDEEEEKKEGYSRGGGGACTAS